MPDHAEIKSCAERHETAYAELIILYIALSQNVLHKKLAGNIPVGYCPPTMLTQRSEYCIL